MVICYWLEMPEGAALFRPTYMGIGGGVVFGRQRRKALRFSGLHVWVSVVVWCLVGNAGRRCAFPAYMYGYRRWCVWWGELYQPKNPLPKIKNVGWKSRRCLPPIPKCSIPSGICQNKRCLHTEKSIICRPTYSYICGELLLGGNAGRRYAFPAYMCGFGGGVVFGGGALPA